MKKILVLLLICFGLIKAQKADWKKMVETEYAFAAKAGETNIRESFLTFIAIDGILFRPNPLNGREFLEKSKPRSGLLEWFPSMSEISSSGDMGFTTGPWLFRKEKTDTTDIAFGDFCTIWEKQNDGSWKFAIDYGVGHDKYKVEPVAYLPENIVEKKSSSLKQEPFITITSLDNSNNSKLPNLPLRVYSKKSRLLVDENYPIDGNRNIQNFFSEHLFENFIYQPNGGKISKANDFGFTYGLLKLEYGTEKNKKEIYYMRVWQKENNEWNVLAEVWNDKPVEKKN